MLRIATRRSALARAQATQVGLTLDAAFELVPMATTGDLHPERAVEAFDTKGLFVDAIRQAVVDGTCHLAVHSAKDLPSEHVDGLTIGAYPRREDPRDVLITGDGHLLASLPSLATVGTSSSRRRLQLLRVRPDLQVMAVRGNIDTRLRKVADGELDAVVLALAGLRRLYTDPDVGGIGPLGLPLRAVTLEPGECLPAPAQGALAIECRSDDTATLTTLAAIDDPVTRVAVEAERGFQRLLGGGCLTPIGALASVAGDQIELAGMLADPVRRRVLRQSASGTADDPVRVARELAARIRELGGDAMLDNIERQERAGHAG
ncbi:hydroxymethylbilane synthase [soil metagenome]